MAAPPPTSVVVVSRGRPDLLPGCLAALAQSDHPALEVVVVACPAGARAVGDFAGRIRLTLFDEANIAAARNRGIALASGAVVAFIDDDARCEPTWAARLAAPFADARVVAAAGFTRGRNGISWQWRAAEVDATGQDHPLDVPADVSLHAGSAVRAVKTPGTNCAFRRAALAAAGGFDPAFRFYLDEADANLRLAAAGGLTAVVPGAQVIHGFAASALRRADRVPRDLRPIGASVAAFLLRHAPAEARAEAVSRARSDQRARLVRHMVAGLLAPGDVPRLLAGFDAGLAEGARRLPAPLPPLPPPAQPFLPWPDTGPRPGLILAPAPRDRERAEGAARAARAAGAIVTILHLAPGWRRHRMRFRDDGIWEQAGGLWGRSDRSRPPLMPWQAAAAPAARAAAETARIAGARPVGGWQETAEMA